MTAVCGVYSIINRLDGSVYIGSSLNLHQRKLRHFRYLKQGIHENAHLQRAYSKYGADAFEFTIISKSSPETRLKKEQALLDEYVGKSNCYNILRIAGSPAAAGRIKSDIHRRRISAGVTKYFKDNPDARRWLSSLRKGQPLSEGTKQKMRDGHKRGTLHHNSRLDEAAVRSIRAKYTPREYSYGMLAKEYGVDKKTIIRIINKVTWTHIK